MIRSGWRVRGGLGWLLAVNVLACGTSEPTKQPARPTSEAPTQPVTPPTPSKPETPNPPEPPEVTEVTDAAASSINAVAIDLHRALADRPGDLFISPASIAIAFAMVHAGARAATEEELARVFHLGKDGAKAREALAATLASWSRAGGGVELAVANRLFGEKTVRFEAAYLAVARDSFAAPLEALDFKTAPQPARAQINKWVAERTHDKIKDLLPPTAIDPMTRLVLVNAVYFKASWGEPFLAAFTQPAKFHGPTGPRDVKMMTRTDDFALAAVPDAKLRALELPYAGGEFAMVVVLPDAKDGLAAVEKRLTAAALAGWLEQLTPQRVALKLPRFTIEPGEGLKLSAVLRGLGLRESFDPERADFTGMAAKTEQIYISEAYHKAFIAVDEQGTEAAAATAVVGRGGGMPPNDPPIEFTADHPFLFLIRDTRSGAILFMGRLADPQAK